MVQKQLANLLQQGTQQTAQHPHAGLALLNVAARARSLIASRPHCGMLTAIEAACTGN